MESNYSDVELFSVSDSLIEMLDQVTVTSCKVLCLQ